MTAGFAAVFVQRTTLVSNVSLTYGALFLGPVPRRAPRASASRCPYADPYLFPLVAVLASVGLVMIYRLDDELAREQAQWFVVGLGLFAATIVLLRDYRVLERYRYLIAPRASAAARASALPGIGAPVNGAYLGVEIGPMTFQPAEFAKIGIIIFLASYLRDTRQLLVHGARRVAAHDPAAQAPRAAARGLGRGDGDALLHPRPRLVADVLRRLPGDALRRDEPAARSSPSAWRCSASARGSSTTRARPSPTASTPGSIRSTPLYDQVGGSYQLAQSLFAQADGGLFGRASARRCSRSARRRPLLPAAQTDLIYAVIVNELGLVGACAVLLRLPAGRRARLQDRHARARLVLQAARRRPDDGVRAAGLRDRRRRHQGDPADRRDAARSSPTAARRSSPTSCCWRCCC